MFDITETWGMYSKKGNESITNKFNVLLRRLNKPEIKHVKRIEAFSLLFKSFTKMENTKSYSEAGDTDVRDQVWSAAVTLGKKYDIGFSTLDQLWEYRYDK